MNRHFGPQMVVGLPNFGALPTQLMSSRYFIHLAYNGQRYHGWQVQPNAITVQEVLGDCLSKLLGETIGIVGCGRTDTGVHATDFYAHFDYNGSRDVTDAAFRLNRFLPPDIVVYAIYPVGEEDHTRFGATARTYHYKVATRKNPFTTESHWLIDQPLDVSAMNEAANVLFDYSDFTSFSKVGTQVKTNLCEIMQAEWLEGDGELIFVVKANRFLRNMVRAIVGTLVDVGLGKSTVEDVRNIIEEQNRSAAGTSVPAHGLYLVRVDYPQNIMERNQPQWQQLQAKR